MNYKMNKFSEAARFFAEGSKIGDELCMYKYGKMLFIGEGIKQNEIEAIKYFAQSKGQGYEKSGYFLKSLNTLKSIKKFSKLSPETQLILITNNIKNIEINKQLESQFNQIILQPKKTEKLFYNKSLKSSVFYDFLKLYKMISIEVEFTSASFNSIINLIVKIRNKNLPQLKIGVVWTSFSGKFKVDDFSKVVSYYKIDSSSSVTVIEPFAFNKCKKLLEVKIPESVLSIGSFAFSECSILCDISIPSHLQMIGSSAFFECKTLKHITIPSTVTIIESSCFSKCSSLEEIIIPSSVTIIKTHAFSYCSSLKQIKIPVSKIDSHTFKGCSSLE